MIQGAKLKMLCTSQIGYQISGMTCAMPPASNQGVAAIHNLIFGNSDTPNWAAGDQLPVALRYFGVAPFLGCCGEALALFELGTVSVIDEPHRSTGGISSTQHAAYCY